MYNKPIAPRKNLNHTNTISQGTAQIISSVANSLRSKMANVSEKNGQNGQSVFIAFLCDNFLVNVKIFEKNSKTF